MAKRNRRIYKLIFDDLDGLWIRVRSIPIGQLQKLMALDLSIDGDSQTRTRAITDLLESFAGALEEWNYEDEDGNPLPPTLETLRDEDTDFIMQLAGQWLKTISQVTEDSDLGKGSTSGSTFPEGSLPMEPLSESLMS